MEMCEFARPWYRSDVILRAEDRQFHVHRNTLGLWSSVFEGLIKARKTANEIIDLPKKKAKEIYELLLVIYNLHTVNSQNIMSLLKLAKEFEIEKVLYLCSAFLLEIEKPDLKCINFLLLAERYGMEDVKQQCFEIAASFSLNHLRTSEKFAELSMESKFRIAEIMLMNEHALVEELKAKSSRLLRTVYLTGHEKFVADMQPNVRRPFVYSCRKRPTHSVLKENGRILPRVYDLECSVCRSTTENWARRKEQHYPMNKELYDATLMKEMFNLCHGQKDIKITL